MTPKAAADQGGGVEATAREIVMRCAHDPDDYDNMACVQCIAAALRAAPPSGGFYEGVNAAAYWFADRRPEAAKELRELIACKAWGDKASAPPSGLTPPPHDPDCISRSTGSAIGCDCGADQGTPPREASGGASERDTREVMDALVTALTRLYVATADYIRINHLGPVHHNMAMQMARDALIAAGSSATPSNVGHDGPTRSEPVTPKAQRSSGDVERVVRALEVVRRFDVGNERSGYALVRLGSRMRPTLDDWRDLDAALAALRVAGGERGGEAVTIEAFFQQWETDGYCFPKRGEEIEWRKRGETEWRRQTVAFAFAGIEPTVALIGDPPYMFPTLGDEWRTATPPAAPEPGR